ncbi:MAG: hypothetical protein M1818_001454 [Claussenomyces sp. TS43310]|nr:MAG: hypothetical protein M1818_001454 [Claussenomyces sp. TS43310]
MAGRPTFIDLRSQTQDSLSKGCPTPRALSSPRFHLAGDVPPELSPLDAFAAQSRLLAKQLKASANGGRRVSRLPPLAITSSLDLARPGYFRSVSVDDLAIAAKKETQMTAPVSKTDLEVPAFRPKSVYPRMSVAPVPSLALSETRPSEEEQLRGRRSKTPTAVFDMRREQSSSPMACDHGTIRRHHPSRDSSSRPSIESVRRRDQPPRSPGRQPDISLGPRGHDGRTLAPPRSPFAHKTRSVRSVSVEDSDDEYPTSMDASNVSGSRKLSSSSILSTSPTSPFVQSIPRSPSLASEFSAGESRLSRPTFNFSRPLSRASEMPPEFPARQASSDSQPSFVLANDILDTPVSIHGDEYPDPGTGPPGAPSYVYSRFSLPRGKMLQRNSRIFQDRQPLAEFHWEQPAPTTSNVHAHDQQQPVSPPSPSSRPSTSSMSSTSTNRIESLSSRNSADQQGCERSDQVDSTVLASQAPSIASDSTVKGNSLAPSAEEHVAKAIECHEIGSLNESTYHLRIAARQNHPTGMLLYALACRHGWGMRPNQKEGVHWLRKAADFAILEVADDEDSKKEGKPVDVVEQKLRKAQFALSIYELGVSHMNGWGIEQDKVLALRCFEIAGAWGDGDALAEAGFCYAQGSGCKKDLKKSARFYRMAESKGISMDL